MYRRLSLLAAMFVLGSLVGRDSFSTEITAERSPHGVVVKIDGKLFTEYLVQSGNKPILWPIIGPTGKPMTRDYPMREAARRSTTITRINARCGSRTATSTA